MTKESQMVDNICKSPVISIQSDWEDVVFTTNQEIWISCKTLGKDSIHSTLRNNGKGSIACTTNDFSVLSISQNAMKIKHNSSGRVYFFVPALKVFAKTHKKKIVSLCVADSGLGVSVCAENNLVVWSTVTGEILKTLTGHVCNVYKCKFFPSGIVVLSGGADMQLKIWSAETGDCPVTLIGHKAPINDFCMVDRGRNVISVSNDGTAKLWDCGKSACIDTILECSSVLNCCSIGIIPSWINVNRKIPLSDREVGTDNKLLMIGAEDGHVYGVAVFSREIVIKIKTDSAVNMILLSNDKLILGCQNGKIEIYKLSDLKVPEKIIHESSSPILSGCIYKNNGFLAGRNDGTITYYDCLNYLDVRISLTGSDCDPITDISCSSSRIFTACRDGKIRQYTISDSLLKQ